MIKGFANIFSEWFDLIKYLPLRGLEVSGSRKGSEVVSVLRLMRLLDILWIEMYDVFLTGLTFYASS